MFQNNIRRDTPVNCTAALADHHLSELRDDSAIPSEVIAERGYRTVIDPAELFALGFPKDQARAGLLIPLHDVYGRNSRYVLKPDEPRPGVKYEQMRGQATILDVPLRCQPALLDPAEDLWIVEGHKKADALAGIGKCTIALAGVWNWCHDGGKPLPDWEHVAPTLEGRRVYVCFDSDAATNPKVRLAERRLADFLSQHGAWVSIVRLPAAQNGRKLGVDDYLALHGVESLEALVQHAIMNPCDQIRLLQHKLDLAQQQNERIKRQLHAQTDIRRIPNKQMRGNDKDVLIAWIYEAARRANNGQNEFTLATAALCDATGLSDDTVSKAIDRIAETGALFTKQVRWDSDKQKSESRYTKLVDGDIAVMLRVGAGLKLNYTGSGKGTGEWGGKRQCPKHPHAEVFRRVSWICSECDEVVEQPGQLPLKPQDAASAIDDFGKWAVSLDKQGDEADSDTERTPHLAASAGAPDGGSEGACAAPTDTFPPSPHHVSRDRKLRDRAAVTCMACSRPKAEHTPNELSSGCKLRPSVAA